MGVGEVKPKTSGGLRLRGRLLAIVIAVTTVAGLIGAVVGSGQADARINGTGGVDEFWINSCGMPTGNALGPGNGNGGVKVRSWHRPGNQRTVIMLDGMRAQYDFSGWEINTNIQELVKQGINVVEPIGGPASFYTNWNAASNFNGQQAPYKWECVINDRLAPALRARHFGTKGGKFAIMGVSSGGNAALTLAAHRRDLYYAAGSLSGYDFLSAPGMHTMLRLAMLDVAPAPWNVDAMWGPPWDPRWYQNDPSMLLNQMHGLNLFVGSGNGLFGQYNALPNVFNDLIQGSTLEVLAFTQAKAFEGLAALNGINIKSHYGVGTHAWGYWQDMVWSAKAQGFFR
ncbi:alpha/beta hydrolase [Gordonia sp. DT30]|uniref:alpha/beta hydrolase n=1 Tax=Gordonia sp. DT30 TaxID=3416546 RepID=UPI003CEF9CA1